jgi:hypothetical protein
LSVKKRCYFHERSKKDVFREITAGEIPTVVLYYIIEKLKIKGSVQGQHKAQAYPALHEGGSPAI